MYEVVHRELPDAFLINMSAMDLAVWVAQPDFAQQFSAGDAYLVWLTTCPGGSGASGQRSSGCADTARPFATLKPDTQH